MPDSCECICHFAVFRSSGMHVYIFKCADESQAVYILINFEMNNTWYLKTWKQGKRKNRNWHETQHKHQHLPSTAEIIISNKYVNVLAVWHFELPLRRKITNEISIISQFFLESNENKWRTNKGFCFSPVKKTKVRPKSPWLHSFTRQALVLSSDLLLTYNFLLDLNFNYYLFYINF